MLKGILLGIVLAFAYPATAAAYKECGNPRGPAENVTSVRVSCDDAREFARKVAKRGVRESGAVALRGWRTYYATVRRVASRKYDVRATRGRKVIRFQYRRRGGRSCDPNYAGACLNPNSPDYDCANGTGDGPDYTGRVVVVGDDHFDLDRDGDGFGCED